MENYKIEKLFDLVINDLVLNERSLFNCGFNDDEINELIGQNIIVPIDEEKYKLIAVEKFRKYGIKLLLREETRKASMCFRKCYELAPNGRNVCLQYMLNLVRKYNYQEALEVYKKIAKRESEKYREDDNLYLFLLSSITKLDSEYAKKARELSYSDLMLAYNSSTRAENNIRRAILQSKFTYAYKLIIDRIAWVKEYSLKYELLRMLIIHALEVDKKIKNELFKLALKEDYVSIVNVLNNRKNQKKLSKVENCTLLITEAILKVLNGEQLRIITENISYDVLDAILNNEFKLALEINNEFLENTGEKPENDIINILLVKINELLEKKDIEIEELEEVYLQEECKDFLLSDIEVEKVEEFNLPEEYSNSSLSNVEDIAYYIKSNNMTIEQYVREFGLFRKYVLLIKLIYARDHYINGDYLFGDKLVREVENSFCDDEEVLSYLEEVKLNRNTYNSNMNNSYTRKKILQ